MKNGKEPPTDREEEILRLLAADCDLNEIASDLNISYHTVQFHLKNLKEKLGVHTLHGLVGKFNPDEPDKMQPDLPR